MQEKSEKKTMLAKELETDLLHEYGPMLTGLALCKALGYPSLEALRQAVARKKVPVVLFKIPNRRGKFALVKDVAQWIAEQRFKTVE